MSSVTQKLTNDINWAGVASNVTDHLTNFLNTVAKDLGTTAQALWAIEVKQMFVVGIFYLCWAIFCGVMIYVFGKLRKTAKNLIESRRDNDWWIGVWVCGALQVAAAALMMFLLTQAIGHFVNPGNYALNDIFDKISNLINPPSSHS